MAKVLLDQWERIKLYVNNIDDMKEDKLTESEWKDLQNLIDLLKSFEQISILA